MERSCKEMSYTDSLYKDKKVLVAGGAGLLGTNLVRRLQEAGAFVYATYHNRKPQIICGDNTSYIQADLRLSQTCMSIMKDIEYVFICASSKFSAGLAHINPARSVAQSVIITSNLLEAAFNEGVKKLVFISSASVYSGVTDCLTEGVSTAVEPEKNLYCYSWLKRFCEALCKMYSQSPGGKMDVVVVRPTAIYGPYDDFDLDTAYVLPALVRKAVERTRPMEVWGDGMVSRNFIYVDDVVDIILIAAQKLAGFEIINAASESTVTIKELAGIILELFGEDLSHAYFNTTKPNGRVITDVSTDKMKSVLCYIPKTSLDSGIRLTLEWYKKTMLCVKDCLL